MNSNSIDVAGFVAYLKKSEKSASTIERYSANIRLYGEWLKENKYELPFACDEEAKIAALEYKKSLRTGNSKPSSVNVKLAAINSYYEFAGIRERIKYLKVQRKIFADENRELSLAEYRQLVKTARSCGNQRLALIMETMAATGMRVSELVNITVESLDNDELIIDNKNKIRFIFLPEKLRHKLHKYAKSRSLDSGRIFITSKGEPVSRKQIWTEMKAAARYAGIEESKVFPHNMRHIFAREYYGKCRDIVRLADVLGHSSLETTRIYLMTSGNECKQQINSLGIVC